MNTIKNLQELSDSWLATAVIAKPLEAQIALVTASVIVQAESKKVRLEVGLVKDLIDYGISGIVAEPWMVEQLQTALQKAETEK